MDPIQRAEAEYEESRELYKRYLLIAGAFFVLSWWVPLCFFIALTCFIVSNGYRRTSQQLKMGIDLLKGCP